MSTAVIADAEREDVVMTIERLIPAEWRDEIVVLDAGTLPRRKGKHPKGSRYVVVGAVDWIAWRQATTSLAPHADNGIDEWLSGGKSQGDYRHVITVWNPTTALKQRALAR